MIVIALEVSHFLLPNFLLIIQGLILNRLFSSLVFITWLQEICGYYAILFAYRFPSFSNYCKEQHCAKIFLETIATQVIKHCCSNSKKNVKQRKAFFFPKRSGLITFLPKAL